MNQDLELDDRLRFALHHLDGRAKAHVRDRGLDPDPAPVPNRGARQRGRLVPTLAGIAVLAMLITVGWAIQPGGLITPTDRDSTAPSQSAADAARDKVLPRIAALPLSVRLAPRATSHPGATTVVSAPEGTWLISSPNLSGIVGSCPNPSPSLGSGESISCVQYTEILLMNRDLTRVIRAYPITDTPPQWLTLTRDAVYCGRQSPYTSMVCRIDRSDLKLTGRTFPSSQLNVKNELGDLENVMLLSQTFPGTWAKHVPSTLTGFDRVELSGGTLQVSSWQGKPTIKLDPVTLKPLN